MVTDVMNAIPPVFMYLMSAIIALSAGVCAVALTKRTYMMWPVAVLVLFGCMATAGHYKYRDRVDAIKQQRQLNKMLR